MAVCLRSRLHPQDGLWSWFVCCCATLAAAIIPGLGFSFGALLPKLMRYFDSGRERTAWVGSLALALMTLLGPFTGPLCERYGCRIVTIFGAILCSIALLVSSFVNQLELLYLTYGILFGIGDSCVFTATMLITTKYFTRWRSLALSLVAGGLGGGVLMYGPGLSAVTDVVGWRIAFRIMAGVMVLVILLSLAYDENNEPAAETRDTSDVKYSGEVELCDNLEEKCERGVGHNKESQAHNRKRFKLIDFFSVWRVPMFTIVTLSSMVAFLAEFNPQMHLIKYSEELGIKSDTASKLFIYLGISTFVARPFSGAVCSTSWVKPQYVFQAALIGNGLSTVLLPLTNSYSQLVGYVIVYGACDGIFISMLNVLILNSVDEGRRAAAFGMELFLTALTTLIGPPVAGLIGDSYGTYKPAFYIGGGISMIAGCMMFVLFCFKQNSAAGQPLQNIERPQETTQHDTVVTI